MKVEEEFMAQMEDRRNFIRDQRVVVQRGLDPKKREKNRNFFFYKPMKKWTLFPDLICFF